MANAQLRQLQWQLSCFRWRRLGGQPRLQQPRERDAADRDPERVRCKSNLRETTIQNIEMPGPNRCVLLLFLPLLLLVVVVVRCNRCLRLSTSRASITRDRPAKSRIQTRHARGDVLCLR